MRWYYFLIFMFYAVFSLGQIPISMPQIENFGITDYKAGIHNWGMAQDSNGIMYFGNNEGLLTFDGKVWKTYRLPNRTIIRAIKIDPNGRIFVGGQDEIGYFFPNPKGELKYHSLNSLIPQKNRHYADIRNIEFFDTSVFFQSERYIFQFKNGKIGVFQASEKWNYMGYVKGLLIVQEKSRGIQMLKNGEWITLVKSTKINNKKITSVLNYSKDTLLIATLEDGLYTYSNKELKKKNTKVDRLFRTHRIANATRVDTNSYALGTTSAGVLIINKAGELVAQYASKQGLHKNNIRGSFLDKSKNLWVGMDDGIGLITINNAIRHIYVDPELTATVYASLLYKNRFYVATTNGLYYAPISSTTHGITVGTSPFQILSNTSGQNWSLKEINGNMFVGHEEGIKVFAGEKLAFINNGPGNWVFEALERADGKNEIISGTYTGLQHFNIAEKAIKNLDILPAQKVSLRFIASDGLFIWASHPSRGIYRFKLSQDLAQVSEVKLYTVKQGLPSTLFNYIFKVKNRIVAATKQGVFEYNDEKDCFQPSASFKSVFGDLPLQLLKQDSRGNIWFVSGKNIGVADYARGPKPALVFFPEMKGRLVGGFENIYPYDNEHVFIGSSMGVFHLNYTKYLKNLKKPTVLISEVTLPNHRDSVVFGGYYISSGKVIQEQSKTSVAKLHHALNSLHFEFSTTMYDQLNTIEFRYRLIGFNNEWSAWGTKSETSYNNLSPGSYTFEVQSRNNLGNESATARYRIEILPAWYQTLTFNLIVVGLFIGILILIYRYQQKMNLLEQKRLTYLHQLELERSSQEITKLQKENLEAEMAYKNRTLNYLTLHMEHKAKVLEKIREVLTSAVKTNGETEAANSLRPLLRLIRDVKNVEDKGHLAEQFRLANKDLFDLLESRFPDLTATDLKLSAYVRLNLTSKQIAEIMNVTVKAIEVGRYRLRKKLMLSTDENLCTYLNMLSKSKYQVEDQ